MFRFTKRSTGEEFDPTTITIKPLRRNYAMDTEIGYDWHCGANFRVNDPDSPLDGRKVSVLDVRELKLVGYRKLRIVYNDAVKPLYLDLNTMEC